MKSKALSGVKIFSMGDNSGKTALVSGSSSGLGNHIADRLEASGFRTIGLDRKKGPANRTTILCDLADASSIKHAVEELESTIESLSLVVNNAVSYEIRHLKDYWKHQPQVEAASRVNFDAPLFLVSGLLPLLEKSSYPLCINISSTAAQGTPFAAHYVMSKGALNSLTHAINEEFRISGKLRATSLILSTLNTGLSLREEIPGITPLPGKNLVTDPNAVADLVTFLALKSSDYFSTEIRILPQRDQIFKAKLPDSSLTNGNNLS